MNKLFVIISYLFFLQISGTNPIYNRNELTKLVNVVSDLKIRTSSQDKTKEFTGCKFINETSLKCENIGFVTALPYIPQKLDLLFLRNVSLTNVGQLNLDGKSIKNLTIVESGVTQIKESDFYGIEGVETLILSNNMIQDQNNIFVSFFALFKELTALKYLDLSNNNINLTDVDVYFKTSAVLPNLEQINLSYNPITKLEQGILYPLRFSNLRILEFRNSMIAQVNLEVFEFMTNLESLELAGNPILLALNPYHPPLSAALYYMPSQNFRYLGLSGNGLPSIPYFSLWAVRKTLRSLDLSMNMFGPLFIYSIIPDLMKLESLKLSSCSISKINPAVFDKIKNLRELDLSFNRLTTLSPDLHLDSLLSFDLSYQSNLHLTPFNLTEDTFIGMPNLRSLKLKCWFLETVPLNVWLDLEYLEFLDLSYSPNSLLSGNSSYNNQTILPNIKVLNLTCAMVGGDTAICDSDDYLYESPLSPNLLKFMSNLEELNLSKNGLTTWHERRFHNNLNLKYLDLSKNKLRSISPAMLEDFKGLSYLNLIPSSDERVICDAQVVHFYFWAESNSTSIEIESWQDGEGYFCDDNTASRIRSFKDYATNHTIIAEYGEKKSFLMEGIIIGTSISVFTIIVCIIYSYRQRFYIAFWIMRTRRNYRAEKTERPPPYYDVFISYSEEESEIVTGELQRQLESAQPPLHSCIHQRDFKVGVSVIENIISSMENSKKILLILSNGFLKSKWCNFETFVAHHLTKDNLENLVIVVKDKLDVKPDKTIAFLLKTRTYIEYSDTHLFWDRLTYAISNKGTKSNQKPHFIDKSLLPSNITSACNSRRESNTEDKVDSDTTDNIENHDYEENSYEHNIVEESFDNLISEDLKVMNKSEVRIQETIT